MNTQDDANREAQNRLPPSSLDLSEETMQELAAQSVALVMEYFTQVSEIPLFQLFQYTSASE